MSQNGSDPRLVGSTGVAENNVQQDGRAGSADGATTTAPSASATPLVAFVTILLGGPAAAQDRAMLRDCPLTCGAVHMFYLPARTWRQSESITRAPRCAPHRRMRLEVLGVLPGVPELAGQRRRRWSA